MLFLGCESIIYHKYRTLSIIFTDKSILLFYSIPYVPRTKPLKLYFYGLENMRKHYNTCQKLRAIKVDFLSERITSSGDRFMKKQNSVQLIAANPSVFCYGTELSPVCGWL